MARKIVVLCPLATHITVLRSPLNRADFGRCRCKRVSIFPSIFGEHETQSAHLKPSVCVYAMWRVLDVFFSHRYGCCSVGTVICCCRFGFDCSSYFVSVARNNERNGIKALSTLDSVTSSNRRVVGLIIIDSKQHTQNLQSYTFTHISILIDAVFPYTQNVPHLQQCRRFIASCGVCHRLPFLVHRTNTNIILFEC